MKGNKEPKTLARKGAESPFTGPEPLCGMGKCIYKKKFLEKEETEREALWRNLRGINHTKKFLQNFKTARSKKYLDLLTGFLTEHCRLIKHMMRISSTETDECRFCGEEKETSVREPAQRMSWTGEF